MTSLIANKSLTAIYKSNQPKRLVSRKYKLDFLKRTKNIIQRRYIFEFLNRDSDKTDKIKKEKLIEDLYKPEPALKYVSTIPPILVDGSIAACDGGGGPLGHPKIFMNLDYTSLDDPAECGYCSLKFVQLESVAKEIEEGKELKQGEDFILAHELVHYIS